MSGKDVLTRVEAGEPVFGLWIQSLSPRVVEALGATPIDWIAVDMEHTPASFETLESILRAAAGTHLDTLVRIPGVEYGEIRGCQQALDLGADGLIVPRVENRAAIDRVIAASSFPPDGRRGVAGSVRANEYGEKFDEHLSAEMAKHLLVVQIETPAGVEQATDILAAPGIDVGFVGENDLSAAQGTPGRTDTQEVRAGVETVRRAALEHDVVPGIGGRDREVLEDRIDDGYRFFLLGSDLTFLRRGIDTILPE